MEYKKGQMVVCPHCGCDAIVQVKTEMDGWEKIGDCLACNICSKKLADIAEKKTINDDNHLNDPGTDKFADFLGTNKLEKDKEYLGDVSERKFCKDCKNFVENPYNTRCMLHEKEIGPMDDCPDYEIIEKNL
jgi:hypothetical protein